ncbi:MAG: TlpA disulfide reductase family protein [Candidatus Caldarchaeum sp.]
MKAGDRTKYLAVIPAVLLTVFIAILAMMPPQTEIVKMSTQQASGRQAPDFTLEVIDERGLTGEMFTLSSLRGRPVLLDFVFEWCPHCNNMAPIMERLHKEFGDRVAFVTVMGSQRTTPEKSAEFIAKHGISWTAVYDPEMTVFRDFRVTGTPTYVFIRPDGRILRVLPGEQPYETLRFVVEELLTGA